ncbi:hypothetical protein V1514DRAFT_329454 [Lipomyces japonicus]|uniref:uncharacterized protein n=1 Tax=Lipomyces japonicus TaxID=56871 RepID=UPI0034CDE2EA
MANKDYRKDVKDFSLNSDPVDILIIGNGPSALTLSYLLHGNIPFYDSNGTYGPHPDPTLHSLLSPVSSLYEDILHNVSLQQYLVHAHRPFTSQAVSPVNFLLDSLVAPNFDTNINAKDQSRIRWDFDRSEAINHLVIGSSLVPGGQWADKNVPSKTLSYAEMLSLPGYSFDDFYKARYGTSLPSFTRPYRHDVKYYYSIYPQKVGINDCVHTNITVLSLHRSSSSKFKFTAIIQNNDTKQIKVINAKSTVLATGVLSHPAPPDPSLHPIINKGVDFTASSPNNEDAMLIIGSGFSAADAVLATDRRQKIIHVFRWDPKGKPSPLRACHEEAYPEYANLYKHMRSSVRSKPLPADHGDKRKDFLANRYEGIPNGKVVDCSTNLIRILLPSGVIIERRFSNLKCFVGRIGIISYLSGSLRTEIGVPADQFWVSKESFRNRIQNGIYRWVHTGLRKRSDKVLNDCDKFDGKIVNYDYDYCATYGLELTHDLFVIGSLLGDSLVRYSLGSCVLVAANLIDRK